MRQFKGFLFLITIIPFYLFNSISCTFSNEEDLLENFHCDTTNIVYEDLTYIFSDICANCHNSVETFRDGIVMDSYDAVKASINTGKVIPAIEHTGPFKMPYQQPMLSDCDIDKIEAWINAGMPKN